MEYPVSTKIIGKKVALMADIHSNFHAFQACYADAVTCGADSFVFLGDYVSDLAQPRQTLDLLYRICNTYPTVCLSENRERYMLEHANGSSDFSRGSKSGSLLFTYEHLRQKDLDFFRRLKISDTIAFTAFRWKLPMPPWTTTAITLTTMTVMLQRFSKKCVVITC